MLNINHTELLNKLKAFEHKDVFFGPQGFKVVMKMADINQPFSSNNYNVNIIMFKRYIISLV
jgi:hypothetical protein